MENGIDEQTGGLTAAEARALSGEDKVGEILKGFEREIRRSAERGERDALLQYTDLTSGAHREAFERLRKRGFRVETHRENCGGVLQDPAWYAFW